MFYITPLFPDYSYESVIDTPAVRPTVMNFNASPHFTNIIGPGKGVCEHPCSDLVVGSDHGGDTCRAQGKNWRMKIKCKAIRT